MKRTGFLTAALAAALAAAASPVFAADAYIQSDGTQHINTGYFVSPTTAVELDFAFVGFEDTTSYVQSRLMDNNPTWQTNTVEETTAVTVYVAGTAGNGNYTLAAAVGRRVRNHATIGALGGDWMSMSGSGTRASYCDATVRTVRLDEPNRRESVLEDGKEVWYLTKGTTFAPQVASSWPLALFGRTTNAAGTASDNRSIARIYGFRIYENGEIVHNYVPAVRGGEAGLYDTIGGGFLRNSCFAGNPLAYGGDVLVVPDDGYVSTLGNNNIYGENLYFDTGYGATRYTRAELDYALAENYPTTGYNGNHNWYLFEGSGGTAASPANRFGVYFNKAAAQSFGICGCHEHWRNPSPAVPLQSSHAGIRRTAFVDNNHGMGGLITDGVTNSTYTFATPQANYSYSANTIKLANSSNGSPIAPTNVAPLKIYGFKIYESDALVRSYKPYVTNGVPGLLDTVGPGGFISAAIATNTLKIGVGGLIDSDAASRDAYIESDGTQYIDTGVKPGSNARVELDCQFLETKAPSTGSFYILAGNPSFHYYIKSGTSSFWFSGGTVDNSSRYVNTGVAADNVRHTAIIDQIAATTSPKGQFSLLAAGVTNSAATKTFDGITSAITTSIKLFSWHNGTGGKTKGRIYAFRVYTNDVIAHAFVPYMQDGVAGFYDIVGGKGFKTTTSGSALTMSGKGVDGEEVWIKSEPATATVTEDGAGVTLTAAAAGAKSYKWTLNGEKLDGYTGETCTATWRKGSYDTADVYACTAIYDVFGIETEGEPHTVCTVTRIAPAFVLTIR